MGTPYGVTPLGEPPIDAEASLVSNLVARKSLVKPHR